MTYIIHFAWQSTGLTVRITADNEEHALKRAMRMKSLRGAWEYKIVRVEP